MNSRLIPLLYTAVVVLIVLGVVATVLCSVAFDTPSAPLWVGIVFGGCAAGMFLAALYVILAIQYEEDERGE